jgi:hypothetical protein
MIKNLIIVATLISLVFTQTGTQCYLGAFTFGDRNYLTGPNVCKGATAGNDSNVDHQGYLRSTSTWADGLAWTFNVKQDSSIGNGATWSGANTIGLRWKKLSPNNYIVTFENGLPSNANSVVFVLKASTNYSSYRIDCINNSNPSGFFNVKGVNVQNNELSHMSVYLAQNPACEEVVQSNSCVATITSLNNQITSLNTQVTNLTNNLSTCTTNLGVQTQLANDLSAANGVLTTANGELTAANGLLTTANGNLTDDLNTCTTNLGVQTQLAVDLTTANGVLTTANGELTTANGLLTS